MIGSYGQNDRLIGWTAEENPPSIIDQKRRAENTGYYGYGYQKPDPPFASLSRSADEIMKNGVRTFRL